MIVVDEKDPVGELPLSFSPRLVTVNREDDVRDYYHLKKEIGRGRFGTVYLVEHKKTSQKFAAKFVNTKRNQDRSNVEREVQIMKALNSERPHPRLIQLYDAYDMAKEMCLVLEIVDGGELFERVIDDDFILSERACTVFVRQICEGVEFIHSKNILHLDMKPENILCLTREGNRVKICDFGLARRYDPRKKLQVLFGTPEFVAPEVVNFEPISFGTDMWSVGVICYVLLSGLSPFMGHNYVETMTNVTHNKYDFKDEAFDSVSDEAKDFIQKLLVLDKSLRLTPAQCLRHNWLRKPQPNTMLCRKYPNYGSESESETDESGSETDDSSIEEKLIIDEKEREKERKRIKEELMKEAEAKRRELEKQIEEKKREMERQAEAARLEEVAKKEEELQRTKMQLKEFVERWNSHPNSPYLIGTPIPLDLQRLVHSGAWNSRASFTSVEAAPPLDLHDEDIIALNDLEGATINDLLINEIDNKEEEEFTMYSIAPPAMAVQQQPSPEEVAKQLEVKLSQLQLEHTKESDNGKLNDVSELHKKNETITTEMKLSDITNQTKNEQSKKEKITDKPLDVTAPDPFDIFTGAPKKVIQIPAKMSEEQMEKHKRAYEERKRMKMNATQKDKPEVTTSNEPRKPAVKNPPKPPSDKKITKPSRSRLSEEPIEAETIINEILKGDHKSAYEEYKRMMSESQVASSETKDTNKEAATENTAEKLIKDEVKEGKRTNISTSNTANKENEVIGESTNMKATDSAGSKHSTEYEDYLKIVNNSTNEEILPRKDNQDTSYQKLVKSPSGEGIRVSLALNFSNSKSEFQPKELLKRPEIIALQNEELGGALKPRKKSLSHLTHGEGQPDPDVSPTKQDLSSLKLLKKQPSRDVPQQTARDGTVVKSPEDTESRHGRRGSVDRSDSPTRARARTSREERPSSRGSDRGGSNNRRPSRDVPLTAAQLERLAAVSGLCLEHTTVPQPQAWPDLIVDPQGEESEEISSYKDSLDVPVAKLMKSPSGRLISVPGLTVSIDKENTPPPQPASPNVNKDKEAMCSNEDSDQAYVTNNKLVAWILDIGKTQPKPTSSLKTQDMVNHWESRETSPCLSTSPSRDRCPRSNDRATSPATKDRDKSPQAGRPRSPFITMSREPSSDNLCIKTPWGTLRRSPSKTNLKSSENPSLEVKESPLSRKNSKESLSQKSEENVSLSSHSRTPSPRPPPSGPQNQVTRKSSLAADVKSTSQTNTKVPPKLPEAEQKQTNIGSKVNVEDDIFIDTKFNTLPRSAKLMKQKSVGCFTSYASEAKKDIKKPPPVDTKKANEVDYTQSLKRKSKFPPSPNQKKKIGPLLFSAQDRISQFEKQKPTSHFQQPITRSRSSVVLNLCSDPPATPFERRLNGGPSVASRATDRTQVGYLRTRILDKVGVSARTALPEELPLAESSFNRISSKRNSSIHRPISYHPHV